MAVIQGSPENKQKRRLEKPVLLGLKRHKRGLTTGEGETGGGRPGACVRAWRGMPAAAAAARGVACDTAGNDRRRLAKLSSVFSHMFKDKKWNGGRVGTKMLTILRQSCGLEI